MLPQLFFSIMFYLHVGCQIRSILESGHFDPIALIDFKNLP